MVGVDYNGSEVDWISVKKSFNWYGKSEYKVNYLEQIDAGDTENGCASSLTVGTGISVVFVAVLAAMGSKKKKEE
jgi:hypothetical protein